MQSQHASLPPFACTRRGLRALLSRMNSASDEVRKAPATIADSMLLRDWVCSVAGPASQASGDTRERVLALAFEKFAMGFDPMYSSSAGAPNPDEDITGLAATWVRAVARNTMLEILREDRPFDHRMAQRYIDMTLLPAAVPDAIEGKSRIDADDPHLKLVCACTSLVRRLVDEEAADRFVLTLQRFRRPKHDAGLPETLQVALVDAIMSVAKQEGSRITQDTVTVAVTKLLLGLEAREVVERGLADKVGTVWSCVSRVLEFVRRRRDAFEAALQSALRRLLQDGLDAAPAAP